MAKPRETNRPKAYYSGNPFRSERSVVSDEDSYKQLIRIDVDWCSGGIWQIPTIGHPYAGICINYESLGLPDWLIRRFEYWTAWHDSHEPWRSVVGIDTDLYSAYAMSLAIDLKRFLGKDYYIECNGREVHDDCAYLREIHDMPKFQAKLEE